MLVLSPTRELAQQIQAETHKLLTFHNNIMCQVSSGGGGLHNNVKKTGGGTGRRGVRPGGGGGEWDKARLWGGV